MQPLHQASAVLKTRLLEVMGNSHATGDWSKRVVVVVVVGQAPKKQFGIAVVVLAVVVPVRSITSALTPFSVRSGRSGPSPMTRPKKELVPVGKAMIRP